MIQKIVKNLTGSSKFINDVGILIPPSATYLIPEQDYWLWAASLDAPQSIVDGYIAVNDGYQDISLDAAKALLRHGLFQVRNDNTIIANDVYKVNFRAGTRVDYDGYGQVTVKGFGEGNAFVKSGIVSAISFSGNPKKATVTFSSPFPNTNYAVTILGTADGRGWTYESKLVGSFVINTNAGATLSGEVSWHAIISGEFA